MSRKKWIVKSYDKEKAVALSEKLNISPYAALLALTRGITDEKDAMDFFGFEECPVVDPLDFPDMYNAVRRIRKALDDFERIAVYGDYDADGVTATSLLYSYLEMQGADVVYYVPDRHTEGYGLSFSAIDKMCRMGAKLIITVDNGISAVEEAKYIKELDMELIVTDHHLPSDTLPDAVAVVDPHRDDCILKFKSYAGVGVAYKLICAMEGGENEITDAYLDLTALGTIADVMPLTDENRSIVRRGMKLINDPDRTGLMALKEIAGLNEKYIGSTAVAFGLVPRINAAGRMGLAEKAIKLLLSDDYDDALQLAESINDDNILRQQTEQGIFTEAVEEIEKHPQWKHDDVIVVAGEDWFDGVIGIVASKLVEKYGKPTIVITKEKDTAKGSGRSIEGFSLYDALAACKHTLTHFGGHKMAAGIGIESSKIDEFRAAINNYTAGIQMPFPTLSIDFKINPSYVNLEIIDVINLLEPFGAGNPQPIFGLYNMTVTEIVPMGGGKHLRISLRRDNTTLSVLKFRMTTLDFPFAVGDTVDAAVTFESNEYMGQQRLNILLKGMKFHNIDEEKLFSSMRDFSLVMKEKSSQIPRQRILPDRDEIAKVYKFIRSREVWRYDIEKLCARLGYTAEEYAKVAVSVEALIQLGVLIYDDEKNITLPRQTEKMNLDDAPILKSIRTN